MVRSDLVISPTLAWELLPSVPWRVRDFPDPFSANTATLLGAQRRENGGTDATSNFPVSCHIDISVYVLVTSRDSFEV
jgi:hypothetical protein